MPTYRIKVDYANGGKGVRARLDPDIAEQGAGAFLRDLFGLEGRGVTKLLVEVENESLLAADAREIERLAPEAG